MASGFNIYKEDAERISKMLMRALEKSRASGMIVVRYGARIARAGDPAPFEESLVIRQCLCLDLAPGAHAFEALQSEQVHYTGVAGPMTMVTWFGSGLPLDRVRSADAEAAAAISALVDECIIRASEAERMARDWEDDDIR